MSYEKEICQNNLNVMYLYLLALAYFACYLAYGTYCVYHGTAGELMKERVLTIWFIVIPASIFICYRRHKELEIEGE